MDEDDEDDDGRSGDDYCAVFSVLRRMFVLLMMMECDVTKIMHPDCAWKRMCASHAAITMFLV
jgi:hypothetical protein